MTVIHPLRPWWVPIPGVVWVVIWILIVIGLFGASAVIAIPLLVIVVLAFWAWTPCRRGCFVCHG